MQQQQDRLVCGEGHAYTDLGLALATNVAVVSALWRAIRALEDDAVGLDWLATRRAADGRQAAAQRDEAAAARDAGSTLRRYAGQAQARLDALPAAPSVLERNRVDGEPRLPGRTSEG